VQLRSRHRAGNLRAEVIDIEALARAAEVAADALPVPATARQRVLFGRIQSLATKTSQQASSGRRWRRAGTRPLAESSPSGIQNKQISVSWEPPRRAPDCEWVVLVGLVSFDEPVTGDRAFSRRLSSLRQAVREDARQAGPAQGRDGELGASTPGTRL
jgi:hypothetical protein